jgi:hypothetical protein
LKPSSSKMTCRSNSPPSRHEMRRSFPEGT